MSLVNCNNCGRPNPPNTKFCPSCNNPTKRLFSMHYDIYRTIANYNNKLKNYLIIGGFTDFDSAAQAVHTLTQLDDIDRKVRVSRGIHVPSMPIFIIKECTHKAFDDRMRSSIRHDAIDDMHNPTTNSEALSYARVGMHWKAGESIPHE